MKNNVLKTIFITIIILVIFLIGWFCSKKYYYVPINPVEIHDTIKIDSVRIVEKTKIVDKSVFDTTYIWKYDTITDTIKLEIPIEHKEYIDTLRTDTSEIDLRIKYSGFKTSLDEIDITNHYYVKQPVKTNKIKVGQSITLGVQTGYGVTLTDQPQFSPYIGLGITYGLGITW